MNAPVDLRDITLSDKFEVENGRVFITGTQAIARLLLLQKDLDARNGLNTRGYVSGYRGSPMGMLDNTLWREKKRMEAAGVVFNPGVNEDLAATSVWGTQQVAFFPDPKVDGVYAMWYGKAPGVDRSADVLRHGNTAGAAPNGGVLLAVGDDHPGKSSTVVNQSEPLLQALHIPVLYPSNVEEIITFGLLGWAMSRHIGLWVGLKTINETVEQTQTVDISLGQFRPVLPDRGETSVNLVKPGFAPQADEARMVRNRLPLIGDFVRANKIDRQVFDGAGGIGIVTSGKGYNDTRAALDMIGLGEARLKELGIAIYKVGCIWPLEETGLREFAEGRPELILVEEKREMIEGQVAKIFMNDSTRPTIIGKTDDAGGAMLPSDVQLTPIMIAQALVKRFTKAGLLTSEELAAFSKVVDVFSPPPPKLEQYGGDGRMPYFCSGCPHNTSTKLPEGSFGMAGIGCHGLALLMRKDTLPPIHMGGEGMNWAGAAPSLAPTTCSKTSATALISIRVLWRSARQSRRV